MLRKSNLCILLVFLFLASSVFAVTLVGKISNPRAVLYADVTPSKPALMSRTLDVVNVNDEPINIRMEVAENCWGILKIRDKEDVFVLQPDQTKKVPYTIKVTQPGFYECKINTYFKAQDDKGPGIALASTIIINAKGEGPEVLPENEKNPETEELTEEETEGEITGGVSVKPGGAPKLNTPRSYNFFAITFFILMLIVVILLALVFIKRRRGSDLDEIKV